MPVSDITDKGFRVNHMRKSKRIILTRFNYIDRYFNYKISSLLKIYYTKLDVQPKYFLFAIYYQY